MNNRNRKRKMTKEERRNEVIRTIIAGIMTFGGIAFFWACFFHAYGN